MYYWGRLYPDYRPQEAPRLYRLHGAPVTANGDHIWLERYGVQGWTGIPVYRPRLAALLEQRELVPLDEAAALVHLLGD